MSLHQHLPFTLRPCLSQIDLLDACRVRAEAYGHHLPELKERFAQPDALDHKPGTSVLLCRDKADHAPMATARIQFSEDGPLQLEASLLLPRWLAGQSRAEITRLSVVAGGDGLARLALFKASYQLCMARGVDWLVIGARKPALIRTYQRLGFVDVLGPDDLVPLAHAGGLPHRILAFNVAQAHASWQASQHPLLSFMVGTAHPDIQPGIERFEQALAA